MHGKLIIIADADEKMSQDSEVPFGASRFRPYSELGKVELTWILKSRSDILETLERAIQYIKTH
jgi:hypothetical protein